MRLQSKHIKLLRRPHREAGGSTYHTKTEKPNIETQDQATKLSQNVHNSDQPLFCTGRSLYAFTHEAKKPFNMEGEYMGINFNTTTQKIYKSIFVSYLFLSCFFLSMSLVSPTIYSAHNPRIISTSTM